MTREEKIEEAINSNCLPILNGKAVGLPGELARIAGVSPSTLRYAYTVGNVGKHFSIGNILYVYAQELADYFRNVKRGRKKIK